MAAVVTYFRNDGQRNVVAVDQRIGSNARAQGYTEVPLTNGNAILIVRLAIGIRRRRRGMRQRRHARNENPDQWRTHRLG